MKKTLCICLVLLLICGIFCGCGAKSMDAMAYEDSMEAATEIYYGSNSALDGGWYQEETAPLSAKTENTASVASGRKLIRNLSLNVETENYDELLSSVEAQVVACGGYVENMEASTRYSSSSRYANLTIRVPVDKLDEFAGYVGEVSNVVHRTESNKDITTTYVDTQSRRDALKTEHDRLLELLAEAENLTEILEIESRLTEVRYELQSIESQLRTYDNLVDYATISLNISEVKTYTVTEEKGFWEEMGDGFVNSLKGVWNVITGLFSFFVVALPYFALIGVISLGIFLPIFFGCKKRKARRNREEEV